MSSLQSPSTAPRDASLSDDVDVKDGAFSEKPDKGDTTVVLAGEVDAGLESGTLTLAEGMILSSPMFRVSNAFATDAAGGMGRHLGVFSCTLLMYVVSFREQ